MKVLRPTTNRLTRGYLINHKGYDFAGLNVLRIFTMLIVGAFFSFLLPSKRFSLIPSMTKFKSLSLFLRNIHSLFRFSVARMGAKPFIPIRISKKLLTTLIASMWGTSIVGWFSTKICLSSFLIHFRMVYLRMLSIAFTKLKIFKSIVRGIIVDMVDCFFRSKIATKMFLHNKPMFGNVALFARKRMRMIKDIPVAFSIYSTHNTGYYTA